ncbi:11864_t:CDS:2 [Funneliformis caledonium]|uniref:11864_t:CDS:1 n=1 Tax=Funneliformis caledonium TaxID=1117310 RepID=A0A9N9GT41_9GLOM|nr:11864_t:CDS:2 [Funneliformis caledonium]
MLLQVLCTSTIISIIASSVTKSNSTPIEHNHHHKKEVHSSHNHYRAPRYQFSRYSQSVHVDSTTWKPKLKH